MKELYERIEASRDESEVSVRLSYLEIYNESIRDLLSPIPTPSGQGLMLREDAAKKISVVGITEHIPESPQRVLEMIQEGNLRRTMSPTEANEVSSRSHAVLQINITQRPRTADTITETTSASLNIIDLAGSERASATRNNGARMKEGANINKSLLALGNCINALCQSGGQRSKHVPYRNSKLTRLLKFSLGGNCKTVMIVCVSPSSSHYDETHNTLKYANQAKNIRTKVSRNMLNVDRHVAQYVQAIHELRQEVAELKGKLAERTAVEGALEKKRKAEMVKEMQEAKAKMKENTSNVKRIIKEKAGLEAHLAAANIRLAFLRQRISLLDVEMQSQPGSTTDIDSERSVLVRLAGKEEATLQDQSLVSAVRSLNNSLQMHRGIIMAASQNTKFDFEAAEVIRTYGEYMLAEIEVARSNAKYESLQSTIDSGMAHVAEMVSVSTRSAFAVQEACLQVNTCAQASTEGDTFLSVLAQQLQNVSKDSSAVFDSLAGTALRDTVMGESSVLKRAGRKHVPRMAPAPMRYPQQLSGRMSTAGSSNKALLPLKSPRKASMRRSSVGPRRSAVHSSRVANGMIRSFSNSKVTGPTKKSFRWADEAGEGCIDDLNRRSASPPSVRVTVALHKPETAEPVTHTVVEQPIVLKTRALALRTEGEAEAGHSSTTEWEDVGKAEGGASVTTTATMRGKKGANLFERNFLVKKEAKNSRFLDEDSVCSLGEGTRAPFSELSNGHAGDASSDDQSIVDYNSNHSNIRSSPYHSRTSHLGPVRRKARSSIGDSSLQSVKAGPTRLATGPPLFTASRSARMSSAVGDSSSNRMAINSPSQGRGTSTAAHSFPPSTNNSSALRSSTTSTAAWR
jgi:kinesin family protein 18/19